MKQDNLNVRLIKSKEYNQSVLNPDISVLSLEQFDNTLRSILETPGLSINKHITKTIRNYLDKDKSSLTANAGFLGLAARQYRLIVKLNDLLAGRDERLIWDELSEDEKVSAALRQTEWGNGTATMHRFYLIVNGIKSVTETDDRGLLLDKISKIVNLDKSEAYFTDIFELYMYFILRNKGVQIKFLKPQEKDGKAVKTCDYILEAGITADCKCLIGDISLDIIIQHCERIADQIDSTIGYKRISFGGGIICLKDRSFDYLSTFSMSNQAGTSAEEIISFAEEMHNQIEAVQCDNKNKIKFLLIYYIPSFGVTASDLNHVTPELETTKYEVSFLLVLKNATDDEFSRIEKAFGKAVPLFLRFSG